MPRITVYLTEEALEQLQHRIEAGEAPSLSAWAAAAVEDALNGPSGLDADEIAALQEEIRISQAAMDSLREQGRALETQRDTARDELATVRTQLIDSASEAAAARARCEAQQATVAAQQEHVADLRIDRERLQQDRDKAEEELRQRRLPVVQEQSHTKGIMTVVKDKWARAWGKK